MCGGKCEQRSSRCRCDSADEMICLMMSSWSGTTLAGPGVFAESDFTFEQVMKGFGCTEAMVMPGA